MLIMSGDSRAWRSGGEAANAHDRERNQIVLLYRDGSVTIL